ncbi:hypothetical protein ACFV5N_00160 [Streptomyces sp. NPDC059853]|uniref:hypothetical protein n=1 Tax=Streptomyces sp. NPDC059853 TaxID=3346973 RepID=UPI003657B878
MTELDLDLIRGLYGEGTQWFIQNPGGENVRFSLDLHEQLYGLAPACLIMLHRPAGAACRSALQAKGRVWPEISPGRTVRRLGENVVLNLIHCPDDPEAAAKELTVLVGSEEAERLPKLARTAGPTLTGLVGLRAFTDAAPTFHGWEATSFTAIANRLHRRVLQRLALSALDEEQEPALARAVQVLDRQRMDISRAGTSQDRMLAAQPAVSEIRTTLSRAAAGQEDPVLLAGIEALAEHHDVHGARDLDAIHSLRSCGVYISPLETVIIGTHHYAFRPNEYTCKAYCDHER